MSQTFIHEQFEHHALKASMRKGRLDRTNNTGFQTKTAKEEQDT